MICAGKVGDIQWVDGTWLILDIGFSQSATCGFLGLNGSELRLTFSRAADEVVQATRSGRPLNLVIEAPLSVAFDELGNPTSRSVDTEVVGGKKESRRWYVSTGGCAVLVAAMYLMRRLYDSAKLAEVRLFEGFVSFKSKNDPKSDHLNDVRLLRQAIEAFGKGMSQFSMGPDDYEVKVTSTDGLKAKTADIITSAFEVLNIKGLGIPPVIKVTRLKDYS